MPSTYTVNLGIEKPATGEQSGTWGDTTNVNFDILDQAINGAVRVTLTSAGSSGSPNALQITNGATSDGRNKWVEFYSSGDLGGSAYVQLDPNDAEKIVFVRNSLASSRSVILFQGTYNSARDLEVPAGVDMVVKFDGGGASAATVTDVYTKLRVTELTTPTLTATTADINGGTLDNSVIGGTTAAAITGTTIVANTSLNIAGDGATVTGIKDEDNMASNSATKLATQQSIKAYVDSQVGTVDTLAEILANGNTSGSNNLIINNGQALTSNTINETTAGSGVTIDSVLLKDDVVNATDVETSNISANDGTAAATIANSTGNFTITNFISNSVDIGGGAIDGTVIGGSTAAAGTFTTGQFNTSLNVTTSSAGDIFTLESTSAGNGVGPSINLYRNSSSPAANDLGPALYFRGENSAGGQHTYASIYSQFNDVTDGAEDTTVHHQISIAGSNRSVLSLKNSEVSVNEESRNVDFRVESDSNTHALFVDAGNSRIGFNNSAPDRPVHLKDAGTRNYIKTETTGTSDSFEAGFDAKAGSNNWLTGTLGSSNRYFIYDLANATEYVRLNSAGFIFNESSNDLDFRVESNDNTHMLFVDAGNNRVGVNNSNPQHKLDVGDTSSAIASAIRLRNSNTTSGSGVALQFSNTAFSGDNEGEIRYVNDGVNNTNYMSFNTEISGVNGMVEMGRFSSTGQFIYQRGAVINESSGDHDFRVESNSNTHALFVNAGTDGVGMGATSSPVNAASTEGLFYSIGGSLTVASNTETLQINRNGTGGNNRTNIGLYNNGTLRGIIGTLGGVDGFYLHSGGNVDNLVLKDDETVFNESGANIDFRVESDNQANMFRVDAGTDRVAVKLTTSAPENTLDVNGDISFTRTISKKVSTGAANSNYFTIYEKDFETSAFTTNQHWVRITGAGSTSGAYASAEFYITFKQQSGSKYFNIVPIENTGLTIGYTYNASGGASSAGQLKIFAASGVGFYTYIQVFATARDGNSDDAVARGTFPMTDTGSGTAPAGMTTMAFPLNYGANKYQLSGYASSQYVINEDSNDLDFRVEGNNDTHLIYGDATNDRVGISTNSPSAGLEIANSILFRQILPTNFNAHSGNSNGNYWKLGDITLSGTQSAEINVYGTDSYSAGQPVVGKSTLMMRGNNANTTIQTMFYSETSGTQPVRDARWLNTGTNTYAIYIAVGTFAGLENVTVTGGTYVPDLTDTGSTTAPTNSIQFATNKVEYAGSFLYPAVNYSSSVVTFNESGVDRDFRIESNSNVNCFRVDAGADSGQGVVLFGQGAASAATNGAYFSLGTNNAHLVVANTQTSNVLAVAYLNRQNSDGTLMEFRKGNNAKGSITVSGATVSFNGFSGRHESSGIPANTPVGTVVSTIDELDVYPNTSKDTEGNVVTNPEAGQTRADHAKVEVSTSVGDSCVYGVVSEFDNNGKLIVTSVGIGSVRVTGACAKGDLLESNGDGTATVQSDDIVRSKTIGKVTIGNSDTGVKLVSCVMYCG